MQAGGGMKGGGGVKLLAHTPGPRRVGFRVKESGSMMQGVGFRRRGVGVRDEE